MNGDTYGNGNGMPTWAKLLATLGPTAAAMLWLVYNLTQVQDKKVDSINNSINAHIGQMEKDAIDDRNRDALNRMFLRQLCWNTARSPQQIRACDDIGR